MRDTTVPALEEGSSHSDSHHYPNDERQMAVAVLGLIASIPPLVAFIVALLMLTPR